ncbi:hypothetical protein [Gordonia iterans]
MEAAATSLDPAAARPRVDALADLAVALIGSGFGSGEAFYLVERAAQGLGIGDAAVLDFGTAVSIEYVASDGSSIARTRTTGRVGTIDCRAMKHLSQVAEGAAAGAVDADGVRSAVAAIRAQGGPRVWVTTAGMSLLAFASLYRSGSAGCPRWSPLRLRSW